MLIRANQELCLVMMRNGLTLELTYGDGWSRGVWLLGENWLFEVHAGSA
ncbi:MAG: hypothetical protein PVI30_14110 [Myxococcales bacterium]|jgi:hypothetical protein